MNFERINFLKNKQFNITSGRLEYSDVDHQKTREEEGEEDQRLARLMARTRLVTHSWILQVFS
jgi:hypothetical protein